MQLAELVRRIRRGEKEAVKELVAAYGSGVYQRAYERTKDKELAREAARQTFGQFVAIVQQQPEDDGWSLWFGDLIERNIATYAQISTDMRTIESELDQELDLTCPPKAAAAPLRFETEPESSPVRSAEPVYERAPQPAKSAPREESYSNSYQRDEIFDEPYQKKNSKKKKPEKIKPAKAEKPDRGSSRGSTVILLIIVSLMLLWVVAGVAMSIGLLPLYDLGYSWFNANVFRLF
ncbi:hypothetical protein SDC9_120260 [bioreactor metagenome]|uniref:Uncharacterized protein n=1 Tax=bioreactor metagenome TaxID=1076179 RepID=A0A645C966_9ZZZZ|nr:hypothetical protein [Christensenella sp.]